MREDQLPSPGIGGKSHHLRRMAAQAISFIEVVAPAYPSGKHPQADELKKFFDACSTAVAGFVEAAPVDKPVA